ncbi:hypothetical protein KZ813_16775 [Sphingomonas sp. RHCKR7]|nr:hypothetical protein [Sphingomonas folli]
MLALTGFSGMAHAADVAGGSIAGYELSVHAAGDGDEVPSDSDKGYPHHHSSCHGHEIGQPARPQVAVSLAQIESRPFPGGLLLLAGRQGQIHLRPPQA